MTTTAELVRSLRKSLREASTQIPPGHPAKRIQPGQAAKTSGIVATFSRRFSKRVEPHPDKMGALDGNRPSRWFQRGIVAYQGHQYVKALQAWKKAAAKCDVHAQFRIGQLYARGEGVVQSIPDAVVWYRRAADMGHVDAQYQLGCIYINGIKSAHNGANKWLEAASRRD